MTALIKVSANIKFHFGTKKKQIGNKWRQSSEEEQYLQNSPKQGVMFYEVKFNPLMKTKDTVYGWILIR